MEFNDFKRLYPLSKTLRFEAKPIGSTLNNIIKSGLLEEDEHRAQSYVKVKKLIDEYHKVFIDRVLDDGCLTIENKDKKDSLEEYYESYMSKSNDENVSKTFKEIQENLRSVIAKKLTDDKAYANLFGKNLIESYKDKDDKNKIIDSDLIQFINTAEPSQLDSMSQDEAKELVKEFWGFTTYFVGFFDNRKNMYTSEEKSTGIAYRLVNENLPKFIDNMEAFKKAIAKPEIQANMGELYSNFAEYLNVESIQEMFQLDYYNMLLTQKQIDVYNAIIGGKTDEEHDVKIKGINEYINLYNQQHKDEKLPKLKALFKQILSDRNAISWLPEEFNSDKEVLNAIKDCYERLSENVLGDKVLKSLLCSLSDYNLNGIFVRNDLQLTDISQKMFGNWSVIQNAIMQNIKNVAPARKRKESEEDYEKRISDIFKKADSFSIQYINDCLNEMDDNNLHAVDGYFATLGAVNTPTMQRENLFALIQNAYTDISNLLDTPYPENKNLAQDKTNVAKVKALLDAIKSLQHFVKPLLGMGDESDKDERFYGELASLWTELDTVTPLYNMIRNYMTRKPYSEKKIKLNFENPQLLGGWDANKEKDYATIILRRNGMYYLAIMNKDSKKLLGKTMPSDGECYEKMVYKFFKDVTTMIPKCSTQLKDVQAYFKVNTDDFVLNSKAFNKPLTITKEVFDLNNVLYGKFKKFQKGYLSATGDTAGYTHAVNVWINFCMDFLNSYESTCMYDFTSLKSESYLSLDAFYQDANLLLYKLSFTNVSVSFIDKLVDEGKMYLFQIYNKDFSDYSKGTPNMHTLYWKALFDERNLVDVVYKLNGQAEMFYRKKSIDYTHPTHPANHPIQNKNKDNKKKESVFEYDLVKDRRYTVDKFLFHVPITMNFKSVGSENINQQVREYLQQADDTHIIGIDRGERHLLYLVVIDMQGNIKEQFTLNEIVNEYNGNTYRTNYHDLLDTREEERLTARQSWQTIENIKELKEGYLSQVIHKITQLMVKYHAVVVLEDLNKGFMRGRQKVEKQVYQKFEKMLIDKLNYLVDKKADATQSGGLLNAYQLKSKFDSFQKLGKQSGFLFYIPAWNTSKIDPVTGFVNLLDTRYQNTEKAKAFFSKFDAIRYNADKDWFEFNLDYDKFGTKAEGTRTTWTLCTQGNRICTFRNAEKNSQWDNQEIDLTREMKSLFEHYHINICGNLKEEICSQTDKAFFTGLLHILKLTLQMRNSITGTETDYLVSPVADENGVFYDSRSCGDMLPKNADANGAYNIARKGLMLIGQIKETKDLANFKYDISNKAWLNFAQQKPYKNE
ncbi:type V CRISPR-associated protein Cas12a/Cpf1 [Prevotella sp.]|uniref:type V CRISPR-associated protein Cas12a/Cpf1 n=1 Tax=Prevotella sp. TaxID=59823 RepID=UPI003F77E099